MRTPAMVKLTFDLEGLQTAMDAANIAMKAADGLREAAETEGDQKATDKHRTDANRFSALWMRFYDAKRLLTVAENPSVELVFAVEDES